MKSHLNANGEPCRCGFGKFQDPYTPQLPQKEAGAKLDWLREREDNFFKSEEGQLVFKWLEQKVEGNEKLDPLAPWIWRELKKGRIQPRQPGGWSPGHLNHLADWFASNSPTRRGVDIMQLTSDEVLEKLKEWDVELASKMDEAQTEGGVVVADAGDGWTIRQITNGEEADAEGKAMGHCVGNYDREIHRGSTLIYSLRDPKNQPHGTIQISPNTTLKVDEDPEVAKQNKEVFKELADSDYLLQALSFVNNLVNPDQFADAGTSEYIRNELIKVIDLRLHGGLRQSPAAFMAKERSVKILENAIKLIKMRLQGKDINQVVHDYFDKKISSMNPSGGKVIQIQGKENKMLVPKYREMVGNWLINMDTPPDYERVFQSVTVPAPREVEFLKIWINPETAYDFGVELDSYLSESEQVDPKDFADYFPDGQDNGYLHDPDGYGYATHYEREPITRDNWEAIINDALNSNPNRFYPADQLLDLVKKADELTPDRIIYRNRSYYNDFIAEVNDYIKEQFYPEFQSRYYDPSSYLSEAQQWARVPEFRYMDQLLGHNFIDPNEPDPDKPNPDQNQLFGPIAPTADQDIETQRRIKMREKENIEVPGETEEEKIRNVWNETATERWEKNKPENIVPWQDPENYDNQLGRFGSRIRKWFNSRKANILDPISDQLDPTVWDNASSPRPVLKPEIEFWITNFIKSALEHNGYTHVDGWASFIVTGSLTTYQYSRRSDLDVSLFVNAEKFPDWSRAEMIAIMMDECDGTTVPGTAHPIQCYVVPEGFTYEDLYKPGLRSAYDLTNDTWIVAPEKDRSHNVIKEMNEAHTVAFENADKMESLIRYEPIKAVQFYHQIHRRRRNDMASGRGDFSPSNISYKMMEERGLFEQIKNIEEKYEV